MFSNVPHVEQKLLIHPEHTSSSSGFTGARVAQSLVFWVILCKSWFVLLPFFIWSFYCLSVVDWRLLITTLVYSSLSIVCLSSIEGSWLPLWYIQAFLLSVCRRLKTIKFSNRWFQCSSMTMLHMISIFASSIFCDKLPLIDTIVIIW